MLAPNDRSLFNEGKLDESVNALRDFLNVQNADDAKDASRQMGLAAVSKIYDWVKINSTWENSVDYKWRRSDDVWSGEYVDQERFHDLKVQHENAAEPTFFDSEISGYLVGFDVKRRRFHIVTLADDDISGKIDESFVEPSAVVSADSRYRAYIRETTTRFAATGKTETKYTLLKLQPDG